MVFDKQTAPKELINALYYHSYSFTTFPTVPLSDLFQTPLLFLSLSRTDHTSNLCASLPVACLSTIYGSPYPCRCRCFSSTFLPASILFQLPCLFSFHLPLSSSQIPYVWPTISIGPLIWHDKCLFFSRQKKETGVKVSKRILNSQPKALFLQLSLHYSLNHQHRGFPKTKSISFIDYVHICQSCCSTSVTSAAWKIFFENYRTICLRLFDAVKAPGSLVIKKEACHCGKWNIFGKISWQKLILKM